MTSHVGASIRRLGWVFEATYDMDTNVKHFLQALSELQIPVSKINETTFSIGADQQIQAQVLRAARPTIQWHRNQASPLELAAIYQRVRDKFEEVRGAPLVAYFDAFQTNMETANKVSAESESAASTIQFPTATATKRKHEGGGSSLTRPAKQKNNTIAIDAK